MQAVVSPGPNPLPAEVRLKFRPHRPEEFYCADAEFWYNDEMDIKRYTVKAQLLVRLLFEKALIMTFAKLRYRYDPVPSLYIPHFGKPHQEILPDLMNELDQTIISMKRTYNDSAFATAIDAIGSGYIAEKCLDLTHTFRAGKNWNSHGAAVGAAICDIAGTIASMSSGTLPKHFPQIAVRGVPLGGQRHGSHNTHYVEYMTAQIENRAYSAHKENFLKHYRFRKEKHDETVRAIFDQKLPAIHYPSPRPVRAHTVDFAATYLGSHVLDGECKVSCPNRGAFASILVLHSLQQLTYRDTALALLTTSTTFSLYASELNESNGRVKTKFRTFPWYVLAHPESTAEDEFLGEIPEPRGVSYLQATDGGNFDSRHVSPVPEGSAVRSLWEEIRSGPRKFIFALFELIDVLVMKFEDIDKVNMTHNRDISYEMGFMEPSFWTTGDTMIATRRLPEQEKFKYCSRTMDDPRVLMTDAAIRATLYENYKYILESHGDELSEGLRTALQEAMALHAPPERSEER